MNARRLSKRGYAVLAAMLVGSGAIFGALRAVGTVSGDVTSLTVVASALVTHRFHAYSAVNYPNPLQPDQIIFHWPYPPGYFPWIWFSDLLHGVSSVPFDIWVRIPNILAQAALAVLVQVQLGRGGHSERMRLIAAALIAIGPLFVIDSYYGQIDTLAILPAVLAVGYWGERRRHRAIISGALIGVGAAFKTIPIVAVLALLPTAENNRERAQLVGVALAVPLATVLPFLTRDPSGVLRIRGYTGIPGVGGMTLFAQPRLLRFWLFYGDLVPETALVQWLMTYGPALLGVALLALMIGLFRRRVGALEGATLIWLLVLVLGPSPTPLYLCWIVPFLLLAGRIRLALTLQALAAGPAILLYLHAPMPNRILAYVLLMGLVWVLCLAAFLVIGATAWRRPGGSPREAVAPESLGQAAA